MRRSKLRIAGLEKVTLDTSALEYEIDLAEEMLADIDSYIPSTVEGLKEKLDDAKNALKTATDQAQIDEAAAALQEAIDQLHKVKDPVDTGTDHAKLIYGLLSVGMLALSGSMMLKKKRKENKA